MTCEPECVHFICTHDICIVTGWAACSTQPCQVQQLAALLWPCSKTHCAFMRTQLLVLQLHAFTSTSIWCGLTQSRCTYAARAALVGCIQRIYLSRVVRFEHGVVWSSSGAWLLHLCILLVCLSVWRSDVPTHAHVLACTVIIEACCWGGIRLGRNKLECCSHPATC